MTERLADIKLRLDTIGQLDAVISAMRSIAATRVRQARERLTGVHTYAGTIGTAIGEALTLLPAPPPVSASADPLTEVVIALTAEQGFAGDFSARVLDRAAADLAAGRTGGAELMLVGDRGLMTAGERGLPVTWSAPMAAHVDEIATLADRIASALYLRLAAGRSLAASLVFAEPAAAGAQSITIRALLPFDYARFPGVQRGMPPLVSMPPEKLVERLAGEHVFAELCAALLLSFAAENEARMRAMTSARSNVRRTRQTLQSAFRRLRQEQITTEIVELAAGRAARAQHLDPERVPGNQA